MPDPVNSITGVSKLRAFVLCGGLGTRLRSVLSDRPKSMAPVGGVPFLEVLLENLKAQGMEEVILGTGYMAEQIEDYFGDGHELGLTLRYSREKEPLGTGGALKLAGKLLSDPVVVLNGDSYVEWDCATALRLFRQKEARLVMILQPVPDVGRYGSVTIDAEGRVIDFVEKGARTGSGLINAGIYLLCKEIVDQLPDGEAVSLERDVFPGLLARGVYGLVADGLFIDIGIPADLKRAQTLLGARASDGFPS
ncbi:MAG: nucleotidyltransferase family protein [Verrucomicrobiota bacterium]|nr:nucleotidyltransferase family protein [Verrucomicrobiota bacterium]